MICFDRLCLAFVFAVMMSGAVPARAEEADLKNGEVIVGMERAAALRFRRIPAGRFMMGSPISEQDSDKDEKPVHEVVISNAFYIGVFEVTRAQWQLVMGSLPGDSAGKLTEPVSGVSWDDCQLFIRKLSERGLGTFRLPTEAEWEYACRAGSTSRFYWGADPDYSKADLHAWHKGNASNRAHTVGLKKPNAWGLYDMSGNVWEWCRDWYGPYAAGRQLDPTGPETGKTHVMRGNGWHWGPRYCRSANRYYREKGHAIGLRLVLERKSGSEKDIRKGSERKLPPDIIKVPCHQTVCV